MAQLAAELAMLSRTEDVTAVQFVKPSQANSVFRFLVNEIFNLLRRF